jgi:CubicO group peptidase (beta-lactamase class C family)
MMIENRTADAHVTSLKVSLRDAALGEKPHKEGGSPGMAYAIIQDGRRVGVVRLGDESEFALNIFGDATVVELVREREGGRRS